MFWWWLLKKPVEFLKDRREKMNIGRKLSKQFTA